ncbi:hypothetical protein C1645_734653 [Glomus cerebriforme]|uniref:Uncharacterized protein n=1 Tax=Glomus cerebriforme TaxID=658196 RepID=A0A397TDX5_9GLOM|nr:hypothetical protein C1645_734653 [Glomus cerebriforme]
MAALTCRQVGNDFFKEGRWREAIDKYTDAINLDPNDHLSYTNRATTYSKMKNYTAAIRDCKKSIEIEPKHIKAYYRLANSLKMLHCYDESLVTFNTFLGFEPNNNLAQNERTQVKTAIFKEKLQGAQVHPALRILSWANCDNDPLSCKARLLAATLEFNKGNEDGKNRNVKGLIEITEGIMLDERCFIIPSSINLAVNTAFEQNKALSPTLSVRATILKYKQRLAQDGWDSVLPALATNIRAAFLIGYMSRFTPDVRNIDQGIENIRRAIELASFATEIAPVATDDINSIDPILKITFLRTLKVHLMEAILIKYKRNIEMIDLFDKVLQLAKEVIESCNENPISTEDTISYCAYYRGHLEEAYGAIGSAYNERSKFSRGELGFQERDLKLLLESVKNYEKANEYFPSDDPKFALFHYLTASYKLMIGGCTLHEIKQHAQKAKECEKEAYPVFGNYLGDIFEKSMVFQALEQLKRPNNIASDDKYFLPQACHVSSNSEEEEQRFIREYEARTGGTIAATMDLSQAAARANAEFLRNGISIISSDKQ